MRAFWLVFLAVGAIVGGLRAADVPGAGALSLPAGVDRVTIPLCRGFDRLYAPLTLNGREAGWFEVDTGSDSSTIDPAVAQALGLERISFQCTM